MQLKALKDLIESDHENRHFYVDFDHTLLLTNSTDLLINSARPRFIFLPLFKGLSLLKPLIVMRQKSTLLWRDPIRVRLVRYLQGKQVVETFRKSSRQMWQRYKNDQLCDLIRKLPPSNVTIVSFGIDEVILNLLEGTSFENIKIVAPSAATMTKERRKGKLGMLRERGVVFDPQRDVVISNSKEDDADLLARVEQSFHIEWAQR
ncbi:MAG: hypothetical protein AAFO74_02985 [Pseudomonadota bacterium]